jgi:hypothetical protein
MKRIALIQWGSKPLMNGRNLFNEDETSPCSYYSIPYSHLRRSLLRHSLKLEPANAFSAEVRADALISVDLPCAREEIETLFRSIAKTNAKRILIAMESCIARPELLSRVEFSRWDHVFHYSHLIRGGESLSHYNLPSNLSCWALQGPDYISDRKRLIGMMGTNKPSRLSNLKATPVAKMIRGYKCDFVSVRDWLKMEDGLHLRRTIARGLSKIIPDEFMIFGGQWDGTSYAPHHRLIPPRPWQCSMGHTKANVLSIISGFKFFLATENFIGDDGYLTEKLFNVARSGVVPIYKPSANSLLFNRNKHSYESALPFVDLRSFASLPGLVSYLLNMSDKEYQSYLDCAQSFLNSHVAKSHEPPAFAESISNGVVRIMNA